MSKVVTVMNMKGGVGKTTLTVNLAGILSRYKLNGESPLKVLAIDYDPQFNLSQAFLPPKTYFALEKQKKTTLSVLLEEGVDLDPYQLQVPGNHAPPSVNSLVTNIINSPPGKLDLLPSTLDLMYVALGQANKNVDPIEERFEKFVTAAKKNYDLVIIDCHPAGSLFTKTSLMNSDYVIIPVVPQKYAVRGIGLMMEFIRVKKAGFSSPQPYIIFNSTSRTGVSKEEAAIRSDGKYSAICFAETLKWYKAFGEPEGGAGFVWQSGKPYSTQAFSNLLSIGREFRSKVGV